MTWRPLTLVLAALTLAGCSAAGPSSPSTPPPASHRAPMAEGGMCAGFAGFQCAEGLSCQMPVGQCHVADGAGTCRKPPRICTKIYAPVCGCDGKTYASACTAAAQGASVAGEGACKA